MPVPVRGKHASRTNRGDDEEPRPDPGEGHIEHHLVGEARSTEPSFKGPDQARRSGDFANTITDWWPDRDAWG
jgi:hypothetical protein